MEAAQPSDGRSAHGEEKRSGSPTTGKLETSSRSLPVTDVPQASTVRVTVDFKRISLINFAAVASPRCGAGRRETILGCRAVPASHRDLEAAGAR